MLTFFIGGFVNCPMVLCLIYSQEGLAPINLIVETDMHRATPGGTGGVKTIGNYAAVSYSPGSGIFVIHSVKKV